MAAGLPAEDAPVSESRTGPAPDPVVCFGEMLLRLSPQGQVPLAQAGSVAIDVGGAEANVAAALASLGTPTRMVSVVPDNPLGRKAIAAMGAAGSDTRFIVKRPGRIGLYFFEPPAGPIAGRVTYDRDGSSFALADPAALPFAEALEGASLLHMSGITPALGPDGVALARAAVAAAKAADVPICFDGNYRANLWDAWDSDPHAILTELMSEATLMIGNRRDISLLLGKTFSGDGPDRRREASEAAFEAFPRLQLIASTARHVETAGTHRIAARIDLRESHWQTDEVRIENIVDRIGTGDAYAAGMIRSWLAGGSAQDMAKSGLALAALKHGVPGDMVLMTADDLENFDPAGGDVRR
ncbi:2-keto-3-deoxygluconate kinase (plasmid) [Croceicoccus marinus]|uniref:2-keto-3-deoxygluconate kinase n=2 Tax=Croceicoccus marinus TaxID=450378 RepID=A0A1Z1FGE3_9SPHN|nr:2-keto-3-deoxygluconate kinase [Croceicoccus marinus]